MLKFDANNLNLEDISPTISLYILSKDIGHNSS